MPSGGDAAPPRRRHPKRAVAEPGRSAGAHAAEIAGLVRELAQLRDENVKLKGAIEDLNQLVEERTRRGQQLIGERAQLEARLAERDQLVQQLTWELGAASVRARGGHDGWPGLGRARTWLAGAGEVLRARQAEPARAAAAAAPPAAGQTPEALRPLVPFLRDGAARPLVGIATFGLAGADLERVLDVALRHCDQRGLRPLVLTDCDALEVFRRRRLVFEYLPPRAAGEGRPAGQDLELYLQRRLALIRRKWQPVRVIAFGQAAADVLQLWAASPFEDAGIAELIARRGDPAP